MLEKLIEVINNNKKRLTECNIIIDEYKSKELEFKNNAEQVDLFKENSFIRIIWFETKRIYMQVLNMDTEETVFFYDDLLPKEESLNNFIMRVIDRI